MKLVLEKYKHNTTGKFHVIKLMLENIEKGGIDPSQGFGSIHEVIVKMTNTSRDKFQEYSNDLLVILNNKNDLASVLGEDRMASLRSSFIGGVNVMKFNSNDCQLYFVILEEHNFNPVYIVGKLVSQLAIKKVFVGNSNDDLERIFKEERIEVLNITEGLDIVDLMKG